jgi:hypothetical protein
VFRTTVARRNSLAERGENAKELAHDRSAI